MTDDHFARVMALNEANLRSLEELAIRQRRERPGLLVLAGAAGGALIMLAPLVIKHFMH